MKDGRGWKKDKARKYTDDKISERICDLRNKRVKEKNYFIGGGYLGMDYAKKYSGDEAPSQWFIAETIRKEKLQTRKPKKRKKGGSKYLLYPIESIRNLGYIHQSADFIGKKYISGKSEPINIFSTCYHAPIKLYQIKRTLAEKADYAIEVLTKFWQTYPSRCFPNRQRFAIQRNGERQKSDWKIFNLSFESRHYSVIRLSF